MAEVIESNDNAIPPEAKYFAEAAKRRRADGMKQYEQLHFSKDNRLRGLAEDVFADHAALDRIPAPINDGGRIKFLVLGAGMGGIVMAIELIKKGFTPDQILLIDAAGGVGGTWYWNRYPGLHCDVEAYIYLPLLEDTGYVPKHKYASGVEIRQYLESLVEKYGLKDRVYLRTHVKGLAWDEEKKVWKTDLTVYSGPEGKDGRDISISADFVNIASGLFPYPQVPTGLGLSGFGGQMMHTSRWQYDITGGSCDEAFPKLDKLRGKRVGIIGTGATAIQVVPQLAEYARELFVFQRTPSQVNTRGQRDTDPTEWKEKIALKPGWQKERLENFAEHIASNIEPGTHNLVDDGWTRLKAYNAIVGSKQFGLITPDKAQEHIGTLLKIDSEHTAQERERVKQIVKDPETAAKLTPWYPTWCKRPTFSDTYLQTFNQDNVHLIDTDGKGVDKFTSTGITANGQEYVFDILILSTGYRTPPASGSDPGSCMGVDIIGRNGLHMADKWAEQGISTLHGVFSANFPNLFFQSAVQGGATANYAHVITVLSEHIADIIATAHNKSNTSSSSSPSSSSRDSVVVIEPTPTAEAAWGMQIAQGAAYFAGFSICGPSYINQEGEALSMPDPTDQVAMMKKAKAAIWYKGLVDFTRYVEGWRAEGCEGVRMEVSVGG